MSEQKIGCVPDGYMPIPTAEQLADALENVRCYHDMSAELIAPELLANLLAVTAVKESLSVPPSLPAAGSVVEDGPDITTKHGYPAYSVAQHERIVAARDAAIEEWSGTAVQNGMEVDRLSAELGAVVGVLSAVQEQFNRYGERFPDGFDSRVFRWVDDAMAGHALSAQQSAHVSVPRELLTGVLEYCDQLLGELNGMYQYAGSTGADKQHDDADYAQLRALLNGGEA